MHALIIAESANPEWPSVPLVGWSLSRAIQESTGGHIVTQVRNAAAFERAGADPLSYTTIDSEALAKPIYRTAQLLRGGHNKGWTTVTALQALAYPYFEHLVWKTFEKRLRAGEFDVVHRVTPLSPTMSSPIAARVRRLGIPFVLGPLNGGVKWPRDFSDARRKEREWLSYVRNAYKLLPGYRSTRHAANAILCGSMSTLEEMPDWCRDRCLYIPENGINPERFPDPGDKPPMNPLRIVFVGRLVPYKGADILIAAAVPLLLTGQVTIEIVGDGPERADLQAFVYQNGVQSSVTFAGWLPHDCIQSKLAAAHVLGFPSVREFGGGVVLEAMAQAVVPIVVNYGGPGELVTAATGVALPMGTRSELIMNLRTAITELVSNPQRVAALGNAGKRRVHEYFTWQAKARQIQQVYRWVCGSGNKPEWTASIPSQSIGPSVPSK